MPLTALLVATYRNMLNTLVGLLDAIDRQMPGQADRLLFARLTPDMLPLASQLCFAAFQAQEAILRLRGQGIPASLDAVAVAGRNAGDSPIASADARAMIADALSLLDKLDDDALDAGGALPIGIDLPGGIGFDMSGEEYVRDWALPQFYFHVVTAYAIVRAQGVEIGKANYVPHMFAYLRTGSPA